MSNTRTAPFVAEGLAEQATAPEGADALQPEREPDILPGQERFVPPLAASLAGILQLRGRAVAPGRLCANLPGGFAPPSIDECLRSAGLAGVAASLLPVADIKRLPLAALPCILVLSAPESQKEEPDPSGPESCILTSLDLEAGKAAVIFPGDALLPKTLPLAELEKRYSGQAVFLPREAPKSDRRTDNLLLTRQRHWFWGTQREFFPVYRDVAVASMVVNLLSLASPLFIMNVYDRVVPNNATYTLWVLVAGLMFAHFMDFALRNLRSRFVDTAARNADVIITSMLMDRILHMRLDSKPESTGGLVNNLREFEQVRDFFGSTTLLALFDLPFLLLFVLLVASIGGPMVLLVIAALPLMLGFIWLVQIPFQRSIDRQFKQNIHKNSLLVEIVGGLETVKSILAQGYMKKRWEEVVDAAAAESANSRRLASLAQTGSLFITYCVNAGVIVMGVYQITGGTLTQGGLIACVILVGRSMGPFMQLAAMLTQLQKARIALNALEHIVRAPLEKQGDEASDSGGLRPDYLLSNVSFRYPGSAGKALRGISLRIRSGEKVGVIGATGSGKSTLARLLVGLFEPEDGNIAFGGVDIRQLDQNGLRSRVGFMPQDNYLFYGSVRENIAMGTPWMDMKTIAVAARLAGVTEFVNKHPLGYEMPVGERGLALSGGQRQAVALARTLIRNPEVLILDEPSSNLDMAGEYRLMLRLKSLLGGKTLIIMTHRPSLLSLVDRVIVMHDGTALADGPRDAVLREVREGRLKTSGVQHG